MFTTNAFGNAGQAFAIPQKQCRSAHSAPVRSGFTLVEVMVAVAMMALMGLALYAGIGFAFTQLRLARENLRATQILEGKMEIVRQYNWDQVANLPGFIPSTFTESFFANNPTNTPANFVYSGLVTVTNAPVTETYSNDLRMVQIQLTWKSGNLLHKRKAVTFVSQYGLQKYVY
jgi:prepilin-type N-terminal cleavage/methylation domain-containing protein